MNFHFPMNHRVKFVPSGRVEISSRRPGSSNQHLRQAEAITGENFVLAKQDPGSTKEGCCFAGLKFFTYFQHIIAGHNLGSASNAGIPAKRDRISS